MSPLNQLRHDTKCFAECSVTIEDIAGIGFCLPGLVDAQNGICWCIQGTVGKTRIFVKM
jgi:hypothetical protein